MLILVAEPSLRFGIVVVVMGARNRGRVPQLVQRRLLVEDEGADLGRLDFQNTISHDAVLDDFEFVEEFVGENGRVLDERLADVVVLGGLGEFAEVASGIHHHQRRWNRR